MIIRLSSPLDFVYETRNQIQITGCLFTTDSNRRFLTKKKNLLVPALLYSTGGGDAWRLPPVWGGASGGDGRW